MNTEFTAIAITSHYPNPKTWRCKLNREPVLQLLDCLSTGKTPWIRMAKWIDSFEVALMARSNISVAELTKTTGNKEKSLMWDMEEATAMKKAKSVLYLALGMAKRKTISHKFPTVNIARITLVDLIKTCKDCFEKPKNGPIFTNNVNFGQIKPNIYQYCSCRTIEFENEEWLSCHMV